MSLTEDHKIKIDTVTGDKDKDDLKGCFFYPTSTPGEYDFYGKGGSAPLATGIRSGGAFTFGLGKFSWVIPDPSDTSHRLVITGSGATASASGSWLNNDNAKLSIGNDPTGESGTFQAQAGTGGARPEEEAASVAKA